MAYKFSKGKRGLGDITFEEDPDTGIDFEADTVKIETGGAERLVVTNNGVGIGTASPEVLLHINSTADVSLSNNSSGVLMIGPHDGNNITIDNNEIMARNNTSADVLHFQAEGGVVRIHHSEADATKVNIDTNGNVAIGGTTNSYGKLQVTQTNNNDEGGITVGNSALSRTMRMWCDGNNRSRIDSGDNGAGELSINAVSGGNVGIGVEDPTVNLDVAGTGKFSTAMRTPLIEFTDGDNAITIEDGGYLKVNNGIKYNRSVQVSSVVSPSASGGNLDGGWIKFATFSCPGASNLDTAASTFLVTLTGFESSSNRKISGLFMVHARFTNNNAGNGNGASDYYDSDGTYLYCEPWNADQMSGTGANAPADFDPATDLLMIFTNDDSTPVVDLYIKSCAKDKHCYVSHLGSSSDTSSTDAGWDINTGQSWAVTEPAAPGGSVKKTGTWSSKIFSKATIKETLTVKDMLETKAMKVNVRDVNSTSTIQASDHTLRCIQNSAITLTLPAKASSAGRVLVFKDALGNASSNNITLDGDSSDTIDGSSTYVISHNKEGITLTCDGINGWMVTSRVRP